MKKYAYLRVSTREQNPERQIEALKCYQVKKKDIYIDYVSGKDFKRPAYKKMVSKLKKGDLVIIKSIDRLGRNYEEILNQWKFITKKLEANIEVIDMPLLNTNTERDNLTGIFIADLVLQILAYVAETERVFIRQRQAEGISAAKTRGVRFGRPKVNEGDEFEYYYEAWKNGELSSRKAAEKLKVSHSTFYRRCQEKIFEKNCAQK